MAFLSQQQVDLFKEQGYLLARGLLDPVMDLDPVIQEHEGVLDRLAREIMERHNFAPMGTQRTMGLGRYSIMPAPRAMTAAAPANHLVFWCHNWARTVSTGTRLALMRASPTPWRARP